MLRGLKLVTYQLNIKYLVLLERPADAKTIDDHKAMIREAAEAGIPLQKTPAFVAANTIYFRVFYI